ncbi:hypothetical protein STEG23_023337, partial [Scotinomys teguina]
GWLFQLSLEVPPPLMFPMAVTPLGRDQDCSLKIRDLDVPASWFLDPGGWSKTAAVSLYFIFPGICPLSLDVHHIHKGCFKLFVLYYSYVTVLRAHCVGLGGSQRKPAGVGAGVIGMKISYRHSHLQSEALKDVMSCLKTDSNVQNQLILGTQTSFLEPIPCDAMPYSAVMQGEGTWLSPTRGKTVMEVHTLSTFNFEFQLPQSSPALAMVG